ncbi:MAG: hypothetical protein Q4G59_02485, partial [Planctomycetia bacterium]|nr:hypothetical protein [Planctomycetia bacterium]
MSSSDEFNQDLNGGEIWDKILESEEKEAPDFDNVLNSYIAYINLVEEQINKNASEDDDSPLSTLMKHLLKEFKNGPNDIKDGSGDDDTPHEQDDNSDEDDLDDDVDDDDEDEDSNWEEDNDEEDIDTAEGNFVCIDDELGNDENIVSWTPDDDNGNDDDEQNPFESDGSFDSSDDEDGTPTVEQLYEMKERIANGEYHLRSEYGQMILAFLKNEEANLPYTRIMKLLNEAQTIFEELTEEGETDLLTVLGRIKLQKIYMRVSRNTGLISQKPINEFIAEQEKVLADNPTDMDLTDLLASAYRLKGEVCEKNGSPNAAIEPRRKAIKLWESALAAGESQLWSSYAATLADLGNSYIQIGDTKLAKDCLLESIAAWEEYAQE